MVEWWNRGRPQGASPSRGGAGGGGSTCIDFQKGRCDRGDGCRFSHVAADAPQHEPVNPDRLRAAGHAVEPRAPTRALPLPTKEFATLVDPDATGGATFARFTRTGGYCLTGGADRTLRLWNPHKGLLIRRYAGHAKTLTDASATADNARIASCSADGSVNVWDVASGRVLRRFRGHDGSVNALQHAAGDDVLVSAGYDKTLRCWDCRSGNGQPISVLTGFQDSVTSVAVADAQIVGGSVDGSVRTFDLRRGECAVDSLGSSSAVSSVALSADRACVLAATLSSKLVLFERTGGGLLQTYGGHRNTDYVCRARFTWSDSHVLCGDESGAIRFWELVSGKVRSGCCWRCWRCWCCWCC